MYFIFVSYYFDESTQNRSKVAIAKCKREKQKIVSFIKRIFVG